MKVYCFFLLLLISACGSQNTRQGPNQGDRTRLQLADTAVRFLWRELKYDPDVRDTISEIVINESYCQNMADPVKAALGYVATHIGSDCQWDGEATPKRDNLKCKVLSALDLGYQCSVKHLSFLQQWFRGDSASMEKLKDCPTIPFTASSQTTFQKIDIFIVGDSIKVRFAASGVNMPMEQSWNWTEEDIFYLVNDAIYLVKENSSKVRRQYFGD